ncbi:hypothetical protein D3C87_2079300 [compost metagenome]
MYDINPKDVSSSDTSRYWPTPVWLRASSAARIPLSAKEPVPRSTGEKLARA